jgi:hypothetical protein
MRSCRWRWAAKTRPACPEIKKKCGKKNALRLKKQNGQKKNGDVHVGGVGQRRPDQRQLKTNKNK